MRPRVIVTLGNFATRFILEDPIGITKARGRRYERLGAVVVPILHPAAALRGGRFGGISSVDLIREDLSVVKGILEEVREPEPRVGGSGSLRRGRPARSYWALALKRNIARPQGVL